MSVMGQLWLGEYERISDDYVKDCAEHDEVYAKDRASRTLRALGFDAFEIEEQLEALGS